MDRIVHDDAERDRGDHRRRDADLAHQIAPEAHRHGGRDEVGNQADDAEPHAPEDEEEEQGDDGHGDEGAEQHALDVPLDRPGPDDRNAGGAGFHAGGVFAEPCLRAFVERDLLVAGEAAQHDRHARGRPLDIDEIVEVAAHGEGKLVEQQVLRGQVGVVGKNVERRIVAMQVPVQPLHDVGDGEDMGDFRLRPVPLDERIHPFQVVDIGYAALPPGAERILIGLHTSEVLADEIRGAAELVALVEKLEPVLLEFDPRNAGDEHDDQDAEGTEQDRPAQNDKPAEPVEEVRFARAGGPDAQGHDRQDDGQERHRIDERAQTAERHHVAHDPEGRHVREIEAEEPDRRRERGQENRPDIDPQGLNRRLPAVQAPAQARRHSLEHMHGMRNGDRHQHEQRSTTLAEEPHAGPADKAHRGGEDGNQHDDDGERAPERAQQNDGDDQHRSERGRRENAHILVDRLAHGAVEDEFAGEVVVDGRMFLAGFRGRGVEEIGHFRLCRLPVLVGKRNADHQAGDTAVPGNEASGDFLGAERDLPDSREVPVAQ